MDGARQTVRTHTPPSPRQLILGHASARDLRLSGRESVRAGRIRGADARARAVRCKSARPTRAFRWLIVTAARARYIPAYRAMTVETGSGYVGELVCVRAIVAQRGPSQFPEVCSDGGYTRTGGLVPRNCCRCPPPFREPPDF